jgi:hypothetical protein
MLLAQHRLSVINIKNFAALNVRHLIKHQQLIFHLSLATIYNFSLDGM